MVLKTLHCIACLGFLQPRSRRRSVGTIYPTPSSGTLVCDPRQLRGLWLVFHLKWTAPY